MGVFWENYYDCEPERNDVYVFESQDGQYTFQLTIPDIKNKFEPSEFGLILDGVHPVWSAYKLER